MRNNQCRGGRMFAPTKICIYNLCDLWCEKFKGIYGSFEKPSEKKKRYVLPRAKMVNADLARIINSDKLNPYAKTAKRMSLLAEEQKAKAKKEKLTKKRKTVTKIISFQMV
ncbi:hypothetical protein Bca101_065670 [Brassica carinata]